jgi:hypothetical protein
MATQEIKEYYDISADRETRTELLEAVAHVNEGDTERNATPKIAIDCGCGAGAGMAYLRNQGFVVHGFDSEAEAIARCSARFKDDVDVHLSQESFNSFTYPAASLITADASLFFCPATEFDEVWHKITAALIPGGIFSGGFLGPKDTMASPDYDSQAYWPDVMTLTEVQVKLMFATFDIISWTEHDFLGERLGSPHHWHIFSVIARRHPA